MKKTMTSLARKEGRLAYKLLLPTIIILLLIAVYPLIQVFTTSLTDKTFASNKETKFVGLSNYRSLLSIKIVELPPQLDDNGNVVLDENNHVLYEKPIRILPRKPIRYKELFQFNCFGNRYVVGATDAEFIGSIGNTLYFTIISVFLETLLGFAIALVVNTKFRGQGTMRTVMLIPWAVITVVSARIWEFMFNPSRTGLFNVVLSWFGLSDGQTSFLTDKALQIPAMILVDVWKTTPYMALLLLAGLQLIPDSLYEAAKIDGAGKIKQLFTITIPLIKPALVVALIFRTLDALRVFDLFQVLLGGQRYSMATYNYFQLIQGQRMGVSSAIGVIIFILIFIFAASYIKVLGVDKE